jgi:hypothetical protein
MTTPASTPVLNWCRTVAAVVKNVHATRAGVVALPEGMRRPAATGMQGMSPSRGLNGVGRRPCSCRWWRSVACSVARYVSTYYVPVRTYVRDAPVLGMEPFDLRWKGGDAIYPDHLLYAMQNCSTEEFLGGYCSTPARGRSHRGTPKRS